MLVNKKYHNVNDKYWYSALNGWGNEVIINLSKEDYEERTNQIREDEALIFFADVDNYSDAFVSFHIPHNNYYCNGCGVNVKNYNKGSNK